VKRHHRDTAPSGIAERTASPAISFPIPRKRPDLFMEAHRETPSYCDRNVNMHVMTRS
jgi:hypothetical protein